jgi:hypothetical protein
MIEALIIGATLLGGAAGVASQITKGVAEDEALGWKIDEAIRNASLIDAAVGDALTRGTGLAMLPLLRAGQIAGQQRAAAGASGLDVASSSTINLEAGTRAMGRVDSDMVLNNAMREAWGLSQKADEHRRAAEQMRKTRQAVPWNTFLGATGAAAQGTANTLLAGRQMRMW